MLGNLPRLRVLIIAIPNLPWSNRHLLPDGERPVKRFFSESHSLAYIEVQNYIYRRKYIVDREAETFTAHEVPRDSRIHTGERKEVSVDISQLKPHSYAHDPVG